MSNLSKLTNLAEVARRMGKTRHWLYQRLNGNIVNGKPAEFKPNEKASYVKVLRETWIELGNEVFEMDATEKATTEQQRLMWLMAKHISDSQKAAFNLPKEKSEFLDWQQLEETWFEWLEESFTVLKSIKSE